MSSLRDTEQELFVTIKSRLLPVAKKNDEMGQLAADALLLTMTLEHVKTDTLRGTMVELLSLAFLAPEKFFAIASLIKIAILMGGGSDEEK